MPENEESAAEVEVKVALSRFETQLPLFIIKAAHAKGFARKVTSFARNLAAGDYCMSISRSLSSIYNAKRITIVLADGSAVSYLLFREPASCLWIALPFSKTHSEPLWCDVWDALWNSEVIADTRDELEALLLLRHDFVSPEVTSTRLASKLDAKLRQMDKTRREAFLDARDFSTAVCEGCENCTPDQFHRIELLRDSED
jgi:hypothetical protein